MRTWTLRLVAGAAAVIGLQGCFAIADLNRFHKNSDGPETDDPSKASDLQITLVNMGVHLQELIELRVINKSNAIVSRVVVQPLDKAGSQRMTINIPKALPPGDDLRPFRLDFYGDHNHSGGYDGIGNVLTNDHAWRIEPLQDFPAGQFVHKANLVQVNFLHNTNFTDIDKYPTGGDLNPATDTGLGARIRFVASSMAQYKGHLIQARVEESRSGHTVGVYRNPQIPATDFEAVLPGVLDEGFDYVVQIYIDANGNSLYDNPASLTADSDIGLSIPITSCPQGVCPGAPDAGADGGVDGGVDGGTGTTPIYGFDMLFDLSATGVSSSTDVGAP